MVMQKKILAVLMGSAVFLSACNDSSDDSNNGTSKPIEPPTEKPKPEPPTEKPKPDQPTIQTKATVLSEKANIAVFGQVEKKYFSETSLTNARGVLLLDDSELNAVGFALDIKEKTTDLSQFAHTQLDLFTQLLKSHGATVNVLVNKTSQNAQGSVVNVTLDVDFKSTENLNRVRELLLHSLNQDQAVALPNTVTAKDSKQRLNLAFWVSNNTGFIWANSYASNQTEAIDKQYGDLNIASALSSNAKLKVKTMSNRFSQNVQASNAVDILWSIDSSGSMSEEQKNLADGAAQFFNALNTAGVDYRLAVNTHDARYCTSLRTLNDKKSVFIDRNTANAQAEWASLAQPGTWGSATETGFYCVNKVDLTEFDRPNVKNLVVFVSDEPENETFNGNYPIRNNYTIRDFSEYKNDFLSTQATYFSIVGTSSQIRNTFNDRVPSYGQPDWSCRGEGGGAEGGAHFKEISRITGGSSASICANASSWNVMFDEIIKAASGLASQFKLTHSPIPSSVEVKVDAKAVKRDTSHQNGFDLVYSANDVSIVFYGTAVPKAKQNVEVVYEYLEK